MLIADALEVAVIRLFDHISFQQQSSSTRKHDRRISEEQSVYPILFKMSIKNSSYILVMDYQHSHCIMVLWCKCSCGH